MKTLFFRAVVFASLLQVASPIWAQEKKDEVVVKKDVVVMKNGDRLTGEVTGLDGGVLYVKLDYVDGTLSVNWLEVARLETDRLLIVTVQDGTVYSGRLSTVETAGGQPVRVFVTQTPEHKTLVDRSQIVSMDRTSERFWARFNGNISTGISLSKGNQSTQYNIGSFAEYPRDRWSAQGAFNSNLTDNSGATAATRNQIDLSGQRLLRWKNNFYSGFGSFLQSSAQGIRVQTSFGGGVGRYFKNTNRNKISVLGGVGWQRTKYTEDSTAGRSQDIAAGIIVAEVKMFRFKKTNLHITATLSPAISEPGRIFFKTNESYYIKLFSNLSWNISLYGSYDNRPPTGLSGSDYGTTSGVTWTFGK